MTGVAEYTGGLTGLLLDDPEPSGYAQQSMDHSRHGGIEPYRLHSSSAWRPMQVGNPVDELMMLAGRYNISS